jgi:hypothetical protein
VASYLGRADQVAEKYRPMPPLTFDRVLLDNDVVCMLLCFRSGRDN